MQAYLEKANAVQFAFVSPLIHCVATPTFHTKLCSSNSLINHSSKAVALLPKTLLHLSALILIALFIN